MSSTGEPAQTPGIDERAFGGVSRLLGEQTAARLASAHVVIAGVGGVGSWTAEALARSGVGRLTLIDMDHLAQSNLNRQVHALHSTMGASKIQTMAGRITDINPGCAVDCLDEFVTTSNAASLIDSSADAVVDAVDQAAVKAAIVALCRQRDQALVVCGAAGARTDPLALQRQDLARCTGDPLLARVRSILRRRHGFPAAGRGKFGVPVIFSAEPRRGVMPVAPEPLNSGEIPSSQLACAGYGSIVTVTCVMGMAAAADTITYLDAQDLNRS